MPYLPPVDEPKYVSQLMDDFTGARRIYDATATLGSFSCLCGDTGWAGVGNGEAARIVALADNSQSNPGVLSCRTGTTNSGAAAIRRTPGAVTISGGMKIEVLVALPDLSTVGEEFQAFIGLGDSHCAEFMNGVYFAYDRAQYGNFWVIKNASLSSRSEDTTSTPVTTGYVRLTIETTEDTIYFYINDALVGSDSSGWTGQNVSPTVLIVKSAGTADRGINVDYWFQRIEFGTPR